MIKDTESNNLRHAQIITERIEQAHVNITEQYGDWMEVGFALASLGEDGRDLYHRVSAQDSRYDHQQCDKKFDNCLMAKRGTVTIASFMELAKQHGVDVSMPKGRPQKTAEDKEKERKDTFKQIQETLSAYCMFRYNTWTNRPEMYDGSAWHPIQDRDFHTLYCHVLQKGIHTTQSNIRSMLYDREFVKDHDPIKTWLDSLPKWNPETDPDYIRNFFVGHIIFGDPENTEFYDMVFRKWLCCCVALWLGKIEENPLMPVLTGPQFKGKTHIAKNVLPPALRDYLYRANPAARVDKDFIISLSEFAIMFLDEFSFGSNAKSDAYKYIVTSGRSHERDSYGQFREARDRRAGMIGATNNQRFIRDPEGCRRYPGINVADTVNTNEHPLPYEGAYAQALYLIEHGYEYLPTSEDSQRITEHNTDYMEYNDVEEIISTYYHVPGEGELAEARTASMILQEMNTLGFRGKGFNTNEIGRIIKRIGFIPYTKKHKTNYYMLVYTDPETIRLQQKEKGEAIRQELKAQAEQETASKSEAADNAAASDFDSGTNSFPSYDEIYDDEL